MTFEKIVILTPVYNDWPSFKNLLSGIDHTLHTGNPELVATVVAIDDGSTQREYLSESWPTFSNIQRVEIMDLARNLGHQKAIAIGLAYVKDNYSSPVVVMDCDGEDRPVDILELLKKLQENPEKIIFAERSRRSEGFLFIVFYALYRLLFQILTGRNISFGNFSALPWSALKRVVYLPEIWNHFAAGVVHSGLPMSTIPSIRGKRYKGKSQMNFVKLITHGMSAISVYLDVVAIRLILFSISVIILTVIGFVITVFIRFVTPFAIPGWATTVALVLVVVLFQSVFFLASFSFLVLSFRSNKAFIPAKDYKDYIIDILTEYPK